MTPKEVASNSFAFPAHTGWYFTGKTYRDTAPSKIDPGHTRLPPNMTVCITGGERGLGESMALAFAKAGAGGIIICARSTHELDDVALKISAIDNSIKVSVVTCDVADEESVKSLAKTVEKDHSRLDVLINNAGHLDAGWQPITEGLAENWKRVFYVNVFGVYLVTRNLLPLMLASEKGLKTVLVITSMSAHWAGYSIAMGMSKLALNRFMEFLAGQYAAQGPMAYSVFPGGVPTKMSQDPDKVPKELQHMSSDSPDLCAAMAVWLSKEPRPWLNGRYVSVYWDTDELEARKDETVVEDKLMFRMVV